ncbi:golgi-body localization protein domain-containing protein [Obelidium mucronatum]|nr:golgi-body localization protein domain-containing protein [Obelidium mucronatum]
MKPEGVLPVIRVVFPNLDLDFNLRKFYVCFTSYLPILKVTKIINARDGGPSGVDIDATIGVFNLAATFVNGTQLDGILEEIHGTFVGNSVGNGNIKSVRLRTLDRQRVWQEVLAIDSVLLGFEKVSEEKIVIVVDGEEAVATNPSGFEFSDLFEDMINMQKGIKNLVFERMGLVSMAKLTAGKTVFRNSEMPEYRVKIGKVVLRILDDPFESKLARNYRASFEEQFGRIGRDKAFQKRAGPMRDENNGIFSPIEDSYWAIQEYNSKSWIKRISKATKEFPPLLNATVTNLNVVVTPPTMPLPTIEETINFIDPSTPVEIDYDDLICRDVSMSISELLLQLRDFPVPFLHVPSAHSPTTWKTEGLLIIADLLASIESKRTIELPLSPVNVPPITVTRNLCPVKIYAQSETHITVPEKHPLFMAWGMCVEPPLADMIRVLDTFTKATVDPSPPVGWWDKTRHMVHLGKTIFNIHNGDFKLRILGSMTPYYDARYHYGTEGIDVAFGKGVRVEFSDRPNENIVIESGRCTWSIPNSIHESGRISGAHRAEVKDEVFAQFVGGVKIAAGIHFTTYPENSTEEIEIWKSHSDVILKLPEYAQPAYGNVVDSYFGFRSKCIHVVYDIQSPHANFDSQGACANFLSFTNESFHRFMKLIPVYQSPLAIIPIRRGSLFEKNIAADVEKPKLGRSIKTNHIKGSIFPLILSYLCEFEDAAGGVGLRFGSQGMDLDLIFEQKNVTIVKEGFSEASNTTRWVLDEAKVEFTEVEGRTLSFGSERFGSENKYQTNSGGIGQQMDIDYKKWFLDIDYNYVTKHFDMISFVWSPKIRYFKRSEKFESEHKIRTEAELHKDQIKLYQKRVDDLLYIITQYINHQKALTDKREIMHDDSVQGEIDLITSKLESLFEKKNTIERHIRNSVKNVKDFESTKAETEYLLGSQTKDSMFDHHYVMHNIRFLWKKDVRNICLRFFALLARDSALSYCLSNAALKTVKELLSLSIKEGAKKQSKANKNAESGLMGDFDSKLSEELLQDLLADLDNPVINYEADDDPADIHHTNSDAISALADLLSYTPSSDPVSPDYVAPNMCVNSSYIIQAINPQVNFESAPKTNSAAFHSVVVVAETMQFRSVHILESSTNSSNMNLDEEQRQNEDLVKDRLILNIQNAQFFTCAFEAAQKDVYDKPFAYNNRDSVLDDRRPGVTGRVCTFWPMWVPIENVMWNEFEVDQCLERVVGRTSASVYRDKPNPLYVRRNGSTTNADFTDSYTVDFPDFRIEANSKQFFYVLDIATNLLMYHDPTSGERSKRLRKMMLALDQMTDLTLVLDSVLVLQDKIRQGSQLLKFGQKIQDSHHHHHHHLSHSVTRPSVLTEQESDHVRGRLLQFQEEMYVIMEALKALSILEQKKNSLEVALQVNIHAKNLVWTMSHEPEDKAKSPLAQWTLSNTRFSWIQNEDQSSLNTLEIDHLHLENLMTSVAAFKNMISPFGDTKNINFTRNKMVRVYWREMAPVAGIRVVDHFEMNIYPLLLQITRDTGKALEKYFFPKAPSGADDDEVTESPDKKTAPGAIAPSRVKKGRSPHHTDDFKEMQTRAAENRSFVYIKVPTLQLCLSYKGAKEKNIEDLNMFTFLMPTMEYRNKTWAWQDFFSALKKDAIKAVIHNSGALVQQKLFQKTSKTVENDMLDNGPIPHPEKTPDSHIDDSKKKSLFGFGGTSAKKKAKDDISH